MAKQKHFVNPGDRFGRWLVKGPQEYRRHRPHHYCVCDCGNEKFVAKSSLVSGNSVSCGCHRKECVSKRFTKHGLSHLSIYHSYKDMIERCHKEGKTGWEHYGALGIEVCEKWRESFENFAEDMLPSWFEGATIERLDTKLNYTPENCKWVTKDKQGMNQGVRRTNTSGVKGVCKTSCGQYVTTWTDYITGKRKSKNFSINKYGEELSEFLAQECRLQMIEIQNIAGASYTKAHVGIETDSEFLK